MSPETISRSSGGRPDWSRRSRRHRPATLTAGRPYKAHFSLRDLLGLTYLKNFASQGWDEEADQLVKEMKLHYAERLLQSIVAGATRVSLQAQDKHGEAKRRQLQLIDRHRAMFDGDGVGGFKGIGRQGTGAGYAVDLNIGFNFNAG